VLWSAPAVRAPSSAFPPAAASPGGERGRAVARMSPGRGEARLGPAAAGAAAPAGPRAGGGRGGGRSLTLVA